MKSHTKRIRPSLHDLHPRGGRPAWEVAYLFPPQGCWTEEDFLDLDQYRSVHPLLELSNGCLDVLPMPTQIHQLIVIYLFEGLKAFTKVHAPGMVLIEGMRVRLKKGRYREPDVLYMKAEHSSRRHEKYWEGADLLVEVISKDRKDRKRDLVTKPKEYAQAGIPEYWIIDVEERRVRVLALEGKSYRLHGDFAPGTTASSVLLPGFELAVDTILAPPGSEDAQD
jgi:Uma2 family endonuclease